MMPAQQDNKYAVTSWGKAEETYDLTVPSGQTCLVRNITMNAIIELGLVNELDSMSRIVSGLDPVAKAKAESAKRKAPSDRKPAKPTKAEQEKAEQEMMVGLLGNKESKERLELFVNKMVKWAVVQPVLNSNLKVHPDGTEEVLPRSERSPEDGIYVDDIDFFDRMHILMRAMESVQSVGLERFRKQSEQAVGDVADVTVAPEPS
jgi:hypothetical protein